MSSTHRKRGTYKDFYPTPQRVIEPLLELLSWGDSPRILEPCKGTGIIIDTLSADLLTADFEWCEITEGRNFRDFDESEHFDFVITNPPFSQFQWFLEKSLRVADCVVLLLPMGALASKNRKPWWLERPELTPTGQITVSWRPSFTGDGHKDFNDYAWFIWDSTGRQEKGYRWL